jgi:hypothetical protein
MRVQLIRRFWPRRAEGVRLTQRASGKALPGNRMVSPLLPPTQTLYTSFIHHGQSLATNSIDITI